ncbi:MAG: hypothetical protein WB949_10950 [Candidatus Acidiferrales bacterium]
MVLATPEFVNAVQENGEAIRMKDGAGFQIAKRAIWVDSAAANAPEEPSKKCVALLWSLLFVFNEMRGKLLGMVCHLIW